MLKVLKPVFLGTEYLEYAERDSKVFDGSKTNDCRSTTPRIYSCSSEGMDPVQLYKKYISKRPKTMAETDSPFYLTPKRLRTDQHTYEELDTWYLKVI